MEDSYKIDFNIRNTYDYDKILNEINDIFNKYELNLLEALGILEAYKMDLYERKE